MDIETYNKKRDFDKTAEPTGEISSSKGNSFTVQEHFASQRHFDFRLELDGVLKSWAVPKGPSLNPKDKRLAVHVEDHPLDYGDFEGVIPQGEYGGGKVVLWDKGKWIPKGDPREGYKKGKLDFELEGQKLHGGWTLIRTKAEKQNQKDHWLLIKKSDAGASSSRDITKERSDSVKSERIEVPKTSPQLATLKNRPPEGEGYFHEVKFDGYRTLAKIDHGRAGLFTRNGKDWTKRYPLLARALMVEAPTEALLDGEIVWLDENGVSSFEGLQKALKTGDESRLFYYVFDVLNLEGRSMLNAPQIERKELAREAVAMIGNERVRFSEHIEGSGARTLERACSMGLEGIISKARNAAYSEGRSGNWIKVKCEKRDDFALLGFLERKNAPKEVGSLIVGFWDGSRFKSAGKVGTGFDKSKRRELYAAMSRDILPSPPKDWDLGDFGPSANKIEWVKPRLVAEIRYTETTNTGSLRHPVFAGLREDKQPVEVRHPDLQTPETAGAMSAQEVKSLITTPGKILYPKVNVTKLDLAKYYNEVYPFMASHLEGKILNLLRCPSGLAGECFFNKHAGHMKNLLPVNVENKGKTETFMTVGELKGLIYLARYNTLEIHTWNARAGAEKTPDEVIFDLDPAEGIAKEEVADAALELKETLEALNLKSYLKTTGGKGLHLHVPIAPVHTTDQIYGFAKSVAYLLEEERPERYTTNSRLKKRKGKIFLDYLRNSFGATYICPFSTRAKANAALAMPIKWKDLKHFDLEDPYTLKDFVKNGLSSFHHPWDGYWEGAQTIEIFS